MKSFWLKSLIKLAKDQENKWRKKEDNNQFVINIKIKWVILFTEQ